MSRLSATQAGRGAPSTSTVIRWRIRQPTETPSIDSSSRLARTRAPTGTGAGKRTLFQP
jgi:hypothetical protein